MSTLPPSRANERQHEASAGQSTAPADTTPPNGDPRQREALEKSERDAARPHPENYKDESTDNKVVEIGPDMSDAPIEGLDPPSDRGP
jgi:hypothetical protein